MRVGICKVSSHWQHDVIASGHVEDFHAFCVEVFHFAVNIEVLQGRIILERLIPAPLVTKIEVEARRGSIVACGKTSQVVTLQHAVHGPWVLHALTSTMLDILTRAFDSTKHASMADDRSQGRLL